MIIYLQIYQFKRKRITHTFGMKMQIKLRIKQIKKEYEELKVHLRSTLRKRKSPHISVKAFILLPLLGSNQGPFD